MNPRPLLLFAAPLLLAAAWGSDRAAWQELAPPGAGFAVRMPGPPVRQEDRLRTAPGPVPITQYAVERKKEGAAYLVIRCDYPRAARKGRTAEQRLDEARDRAVSVARGRLVGERKVRAGGRPGRELRFAVAGRGLVRQRLVAAGDTLYQLLVAGPKEAVDSAEADRFLDSFRVEP